MPANKHTLWDFPTRLSHWLIVVCIPLSWLSAELAYFEVHQWLGYTVIVLVVSRILWGFFGSTHSRFTDFLVGPHKVLAYIGGNRDGNPGHNPLGGWSVVVLLLLLLLQAVSGLFNSDDVFFNGPLYHAAGVELRGTMGQLHDIAFNVLLAMVALHILAVCYHQFRLREPLVQAMVRGRADGRAGRAAPVSSWFALLTVVCVALALWGLLQLAPQPPPMMW